LGGGAVKRSYRLAAISVEFVAMRAPFVIAVSVAGLVAGAAAARAADLPIETSGYDGCCTVEYGPEALVILDNEPGVVIRRWWLPPWRNRHYYPHGRWAKKKTESRKGAERKRVERRRSRSARSYARYWTNPRPYPEDMVTNPPLLMNNTYVLPRPRPYRYPPPDVGP
jgi:hypothetical protein